MPEEPLPFNLDLLVQAMADALASPSNMQRVETSVKNAVAEGVTTASGAVAGAKIDAAKVVNEGIDLANEIAGGFTTWVMAKAVEQAFDVDISDSQAFKIGAGGNRRAISKLITSKMVESLTGGSKSIDPSPDPAARYLDVVMGQVFESWAVGAVVEILSGPIPFIDQVQTVGDISNRVVSALGISDSSSRVLRPYIDTLVVEPLRRYIDKTYRPTLLSPADAARQIHRGVGEAEKWREEMRLHGLSEDRIEALIANQQKFLSAEQLSWLEWQTIITRDEAVQTLREQGYDEQNASKQLNIREFERIDTINRRVANDALAAYEKREIDLVNLRDLLRVTIGSPKERELLVTAADARRALNTANIGLGDVEKAVRLDILAFRDYREALERAGYSEKDQVTLELILRAEIQRDVKLDEHRRRLEDERAAEKQRKAQEAERRRLEVEADRALRRRGGESDLERAAVIGLISFDRYREVLTPRFDADTVNILVGLVEVDRQNYLEQQRRAEDARLRAARRSIDVGALEQAVMNDVIPLSEYSRDLKLRGFDDRDVEILTDTLRAKKADRDAARKQRDDAAREAKTRSIDLGRFEYLVRRGRRTLAQYDALLKDLNFDVAARAAMRELLQLRIDDDRAADRAREENERRLRNKGASAEQLRRAVVLGNATIEAYATFLATEGFTVDAQALLVANLRDELEEADAVRRTREREVDRSGARVVPLATVRRAVQLGLVDVRSYADRLAQAGYGADAIDLEVELILTEIADLAQSPGARDRAAGELRDRTLNLSQLGEAVEKGLKTLQDYADDLSALGYNDQDVELLVTLLVLRLEEKANKAAGA